MSSVRGSAIASSRSGRRQKPGTVTSSAQSPQVITTHQSTSSPVHVQRIVGVMLGDLVTQELVSRLSEYTPPCRLETWR
jgi:hypothetical protein